MANYALSFDGSNDYVNIPYSSNLNIPNDLTLVAWVNPDNSDPNNIGGDVVGVGYCYQYDLRVWGTNKNVYFFHGESPSSFEGFCSSTNSIPGGKWQQIAMTRKSINKEWKIYIDGSLDKQANYSKNVTSATFESVKIGAYIGYRYFRGLIDDVRIYNRVLSEGEIQYLYTKTQARYK